MTRPYRKNPEITAARLARFNAMAELYKSGKTLREIGEQYGCSLKYIHGCLKEIGISYRDGGRLKLAEGRKATRLAHRDAVCVQKFGCSLEEYLPLRGKISRAFSAQKRNAGVRGIAWEFTLPEWWNFWIQSGRWNERGRGAGYMMCRKGDEGPYAIGNVFIATGRENSAQAYVSARAKGRPFPLAPYQFRVGQ